MPAFSHYKIALQGENADIMTATNIMAASLQDNSVAGKAEFYVERNYDVVWVDDVTKMAEKAVKAAPGLKLVTIEGTVDTSESAGEYMNFLIKYENGELSVASSCWYLILEAGKFESYEEFCKSYTGCSEEAFEILRQRTYYMLDSGAGDIVTEVPLDEPEMVDLESTTVYLTQKDIELPTIPVCKCECGAIVSIEKSNEALYPLYVGSSLPVACKNCGRKFKLYLD